VAADGTTYTVLDTDKASMGQDGTYGVELFSRNYTDRYIQQEIDGEMFYVRNDVNTFGNASAYSITNISVNTVVMDDYSKLPLTTKAGEEDYATAEDLVELFQKDQLLYNGGWDGLTFEEFYETLINDVANTGKIYSSMADNEAELASALDDQRQQVMGVSSDEELGNMIRYQQAYNAASRYINVVSELIETLVMRTGV
jgi:flagellar hook-associated protein 1 FlgK